MRPVHPEIAEIKQAGDLRPDEHVSETVPCVAVVEKRPSGFLEIERALACAFKPAVATYAAAGAVLQFKMRRGDLPAVILAADQVRRRHPNIVKEDRVLVPAPYALAVVTHQLHRGYRNPGNIGRDQEPAQVLVALSLGVGPGDGPEVVRSVRAADEYLLAVDYVVIPVTHGLRLRSGQV